MKKQLTLVAFGVSTLALTGAVALGTALSSPGDTTLNTYETPVGNALNDAFNARTPDPEWLEASQRDYITAQATPVAAPKPEPKADGYAPDLTAEQKAQCVADEVQPERCRKYLVALAEIEYDQMQQWRRGG